MAAGGAMAPKINIVSSIITALELISKAPSAAKALKKIGINMRDLFIAKDSSAATGTELDRILEYELKRLRKMIDEFNEVSASDKYDEVEKDKYRLRVAARACALLRSAMPIKERIPEYDKLLEYFCDSVPKSLQPA